MVVPEVVGVVVPDVVEVVELAEVVDVVVDEPPAVVVVVEFGGVVIAPGESIGTMNFPGGISAGFGAGKFTTGWPAKA